MSFLPDHLNDLLKNKALLYLFLFLILLSYFLWLNNTPNFSDPDSFYHAKIAQLLKDNGPIVKFEWLPFTTLNDIYIDHHFLYHLLLVPFLFVLPSLIAIKFSAVLFATLAILTFQLILDKFKIKFALIYTFILLFSHQFIFRLNLAKVPSLSLIFLFIFIYLLFNFKGSWSWFLFSLAFAYVWLYAAWPIMFGLAFIYLLVALSSYFFQLKQNKDNQNKYKLSSVPVAFGQPINIKRFILVFINTLAGLLLGLIINPYFPTNLKFYYQQIFQISLINYQDKIGVGGEWYGLPLFDLIRHNVLLFILLVITLILFFTYFKKLKIPQLTLFLVSLVFFILTLKSQRNLEYFVPFSLIFVAFVFNAFLNKYQLEKYYLQFKKNFKYAKLIQLVILFFIILYLPIFLMSNFKGLKETLAKNYHFNQLSGTANWFKNNTQPGQIIFHDRWDDWPVLFYHNSSNRYILGLDPTFMYLKDKDKYQLWSAISQARIKDDLCRLIKMEFSSRYIFVKFSNTALKHNLAADQNCQLVYSDADGWIYMLKF